MSKFEKIDNGSFPIVIKDEYGERLVTHDDIPVHTPFTVLKTNCGLQDIISYAYIEIGEHEDELILITIFPAINMKDHSIEFSINFPRGKGIDYAKKYFNIIPEVVNKG
jgi:hypothetical protein